MQPPPTYVSFVAVGISHGNFVAVLRDADGNVVVVHARRGGVDAGEPVAAALGAVVPRIRRGDTSTFAAVSAVIGFAAKSKTEKKNT